MQDKPRSREQLSWVENRSWENSEAKDGDRRVFPQRAVETGRRGKRDNPWRRLLGSSLEWGREMTRYLDEVRAKGVLVLFCFAGVWSREACCSCSLDARNPQKLVLGWVFSFFLLSLNTFVDFCILKPPSL